MADGVMVPVSEINKARRTAIEELRTNRLKAFMQRIPAENKIIPSANSVQKNKEKTLLSVHVDKLAKVRSAIAGGADIVIFGGETYDHSSISEKDYKAAFDACRESNIKIYFATPRIVTQEEQQSLDKAMDIFRRLQPDGIVASSLSAFYSAKDIGLPIWIDYNLNTFNRESLAFWQEQKNVEGVTLSTELTFNQIKELAGLFPLECIVHGRAEMMVTKYCAIGSILGTSPVCNAPCKNGSYFLEDRMGEHFPLVTDQFCRMHVLNAKELSMLAHTESFAEAEIDRIRIDARYHDEKAVKQIVSRYSSALNGQHTEETASDFTRGHYFRGVS